MASEIANVLIGKWNIHYERNKVLNTIVVVVNSSLIKVTGSKISNKVYYRHSGYPGGLKKVYLKDLLNNKSDFVLRNAVKGMLPKNKLQKLYLKRLKIYNSESNPHFKIENL